MPDKRERPYEIGYGKPPRRTQFQPGQSGNPAGRHPGAKNFATSLEQELRSTVLVTENGRRRKLSKQQIIAKRLVNRAIDADARLLALLVNVVLNLQKQTEADAADGVFGGSEQQPIIDGIVQRIRAAGGLSGAPAPEAEPSANEAVGDTDPGSEQC